MQINNNNSMGKSFAKITDLLKKSILAAFNNLRRYSVWYFVFLSMLIKSFLFVGLIPSSTASKLDFSNAFYGSVHWLAYICFILILLSFTFLFKGRNQLRFLIFIDIAVTVLMVGDLLYFRGFGAFLSPHQLKQTSNLDNLTATVISMMRFIDLFFILDLIILMIISFKNKSLYKTSKRSIKIAVIMFLASIGYVSAFHYKVDVIEQGQNELFFRICWSPNQTMANLSPIGYHIYDGYVYYKESQPLKLTETQKTEIENWFEAKKEDLPDNEYKGVFEGKNVMFIQVESLENFVINQKVNGQEITPNINKLVKNGIYFSNYHEQVWNGTTSDAELISNTSVYPVRRGSTFFRYPNNKYNSLAVLLEEKGYNTTAIHPDKGSYWNWLPALTSIGFDKCIDASSFTMDEIIGLGLSDGSYLKQTLPIIKDLKDPFFSFMITLSSHGPFDIDEKYRNLNIDPALDQTYMGGYFQSVNYTDAQIGKFLDELDSSGKLDNTVVVLYGDHGGVHKYYSDDLAKMTNTEEWWNNNNMRIPLVIYSKGYEGREIKTVGGQVDLLPTVAYLMGVDEEKYEMTALGRNLLKTNKSFAVLADQTIVGGENMTEEEKQAALKGIELSDIMIQSNYFESYGTN